MKTVLFNLLLYLVLSPWAFGQSLTHGITTGAVTENQVVFWGRADDRAILTIEIRGHDSKSISLAPEHDFTGKVMFGGLKADKTYRYRAFLGQTPDETTKVFQGSFKTAPKSDQPKPLAFVWSGDLAGQNVCRDLKEGFPIFNVIADYTYDFFIGLGDMIYADGVCKTTGAFGNEQLPGDFPVSQTLEDFWAHWRYNFADPHLQKAINQAPYFPVWDDHEVINDFGPTTAKRNGRDLLKPGLQAYLDYNPVLTDDNKLYQTIRWGKLLEIFVLDTRQYRDQNTAEDTEDKTLLGLTQKRWLVERLSQSDAVWKFVVSSVPISVPTGFPKENGRDGWANFDQDTGFERELSQLLHRFKQAQVKNLFWITTDVHFAAVYRYQPDTSSLGDSLRFHEAMVGPLSAGVYPIDSFDPSFGPKQLFFYGPEKAIADYEESKRWMNFGRIEIAKDGTLNLSIINGLNESVYQLTLSAEMTHN